MPDEPEEIIVLVVDRPSHRLDRFLVAQLPHYSRSILQAWIRQGRVTIDGAVPKPSRTMEPGEQVVVRVPPSPAETPHPEPIPLSVVYEDADLAVIDKSPGLVVHPAHGNASGTLVNAILHRWPGLTTGGDPERAGIVHRLDKDTSGLIVVAKSEVTLHHLQAQFKARDVIKGYLALLEGHLIPEQGRIEAAIGRDPRQRKRMTVLAVARGGREAITTYRVLCFCDDFTLVDAEPKTGRTHQIRVHFAHLGHPLVGDKVYGRRRQRLRCPRQFLHARRIVLTLPSSGEQVEFTSRLPDDLRCVLDGLCKRTDLTDENICAMLSS
jgi:23S rRNA pseudouridine1911/1915/1917 synthase